MKRNEGFIDLNDYFRKIKNKNKWHNYDFLLQGIIEPSLYSNNHYWLKVKGKKYYYKPSYYPYHEIISYFVAKYLGLNAAYYDLAELDCHDKVKRGVISESYRKKNAKYISGYDILKEYYEKNSEVVKDMGLTDEWKEYYEGPYYIQMNNLETIWQALEYKYKNNPNANIKELMDEIVNQYMFAILTRSHDKGAQNWEIEESNNCVKLCPLFDNEVSFYDENASVSFSVGFIDNEQSIKDSIKRFLNISSSEYVDKFINYFNYLELDDIKRIIEGVEHHIKAKIPQEVKEEILKNYELNLVEINEALEELKLNRRGR